MESHIGNIMTLSNSIIGVSILAMPFCFKQCGIILAILMLLISSIITRLTCHFLLKSANMARRRTFELLAFHTFGKAGKIMVELGIIGFLMGTCIAFFVIIGDLGPAIIAKILGSKPTDTLRTSILVGVALFCVLPLGLLRNVDSLHSVSIATIGFYFCLVLKTISDSIPHFISGDWLSKVELWRPVGVLQCLPIFSMALSCQTQLFEIYETVTNPTLDKMNYIVRVAINICVGVYVCVGFFGYTAFVNQPFSGNILMTFSPSSVTDVMKIGFVLSVAFSFPLVIFPCRASLNSLLFKKVYTPYEGANNYIPEAKFKFLTVVIIATSLVIGILIPNIEVVLGLLGSTIGTMICLIFPVTCFICIATKNTNERLIAQILLFVGVIVMVLGTYANLYAMEQINEPVKIEKLPVVELHNDIKKLESQKIFQVDPEIKNVKLKQALDEAPVRIKEKLEEIRLEPPQPVEPRDEVKKQASDEAPVRIKEKLEEIRLEPPQPVEPRDEVKKINIIPDVKIPEIKETNSNPDIMVENKKIDKDKLNIKEIKNNEETITEPAKEIVKQDVKVETETKKNEEVDKEAIKKEETELQEEEKTKVKEDDEKQKEELLETLKEHKKEQENLIKEQKELIQELKKEKQELKEKKKIEINAEQEVRRQAANQILEIAKKAIQQLAPEAISKNPLLVQDTINKKQESEKINTDNKPDNKLIKTSIITDPIAKKIIDFANNNYPNYNNNIQNKNPENSAQNEIPLIPLPMALNDKTKTLNVKNKESQNAQQEIPENEINKLSLQNNSAPLVPEIQVNEKQNQDEVKQEPPAPKPVISQKEVLRENKEKIELEQTETQIGDVLETKKEKSLDVQIKNNEVNKVIKPEERPIENKISNENILPAKRDILANEGNTENLVRIKRDADDTVKEVRSENNEKCELTEKNNLEKTESPLALKLETEISKTDILKLESSSLIQSMKSQLQAESIRMKKK